MATDSISSLSDAAFLAMAQNLHATISALPATYGLSVGYVAALNAAMTDFDLKLTTHVATQAAGTTATANKNGARDALDVLVREGRTMARAAKIPEGDYLALGIPSSSNPAPSNATVPAAAVDTRERLRHTIS